MNVFFIYKMEAPKLFIDTLFYQKEHIDIKLDFFVN